MKKLVGALFQSMLLIIGFAAKAQDAKTLTLERIFSSNEFRGEWFGQLTWFEEGNAYTTLEQSEAVPGG
jgi:dipeptidyl-peptidase 4